MNLLALQDGLEVKNYKNMCELLEEEEKTGESKKAQQKEWSCHFYFAKNGQKYIIIEIYANPLQKDDRRVLGNRAKYLEFGELIVLNYISKCEKNRIQKKFVSLAKDLN